MISRGGKALVRHRLILFEPILKELDDADNGTSHHIEFECQSLPVTNLDFVHSYFDCHAGCQLDIRGNSVNESLNSEFEEVAFVFEKISIQRPLERDLTRA